MKQNFLMGLIIFGCGSFLYADTIKSIEDINNRIHETQIYLDKMSLNLIDILEKGYILKNKQKEIESKINSYLKSLDYCSTSKLDNVDERLCIELVKSDYSNRLQTKRKSLQEAIRLNNMEKNHIKAKLEDNSIVQSGLQVLKEVKKVLKER